MKVYVCSSYYNNGADYPENLHEETKVEAVFKTEEDAAKACEKWARGFSDDVCYREYRRQHQWVATGDNDEYSILFYEEFELS